MSHRKHSVFHFRQFSIDQQHCAMKVGTDGVLLGAWAGNKTPLKILDIGTGSGLIALMMAQRFPTAIVHAIDIDESACEQALINVATSPYSERVQVFHASLTEWSTANWHHYDLIVCNPPYFKQGWPVDNPLRKKARDAAFLPLEELFSKAAELVAPDGRIALILPATLLQEVEKVSVLSDWKECRQLKVFTRAGKPVERILIEWGHTDEASEVGSLLLEDTSGYTRDYVDLAGSFYLKMK